MTGCPDWPFKRVAWESGFGWAEEEEESLLEEEKGGMMNWDLGIRMGIIFGFCN